jgi:hypothetical protein
MDNLNPIEYGKLLAKVEGLETKVNSMDTDIKTLLALANQSKGGFWMGMTIASIIGGILAWLAQHWMK